MRSSTLVLPLLLLISPGDGTSSPPASAPPDDAWNPLRAWQRLVPDSGDAARRRVAFPKELPACPMPVAPLPAKSEAAGPPARPSMPIVRSGCWNPLFRKTALETPKDRASP